MMVGRGLFQDQTCGRSGVTSSCNLMIGYLKNRVRTLLMGVQGSSHRGGTVHCRLITIDPPRSLEAVSSGMPRMCVKP
jgi:hypothetical protein